MMNNIMDNTIEIMMNKFFGIVKEKYNDARSEKALKKACESSSDDKSDIIEANMRLISDALQQDLNQSVMYTEDELKKIFDDSYDNYIKDDTSDEIKDELWERFRLYMPQYLRRYEEFLSVGDKRILQKIRELDDKIQNTNNMDTKKMFHEEIRKLRAQLPYRSNVPCIDFDKIYGARVSFYQPISTYYVNCFDFDRLKRTEESKKSEELGESEKPEESEESENQNSDKDRNLYDPNQLTDIFELRFLIKNIGNSIITKVAIEDVNIMYVSKIHDISYDNGMGDWKSVAVHNQKIENILNILPEAEDFIHLILTVDDMSIFENEELQKDELQKYGLQNDELQNRILAELEDWHKNERLYISFVLGLQGNITRKYRYSLFLAKKIQSKDNDSIYGEYTIGDVNVTEIQ